MGNKCCRVKKVDGLETGNPALLAIKEAQRKYFNSHIESELDESCDDDDDDKDDLDGSQCSLVAADDCAFENGTATTFADTAEILPSTINPGSNDTSSPATGSLAHVISDVTAKSDNPDSWKTQVVAAPATKVAAVPSKPQTGVDKSTSDEVKKRVKAKFIRLSKRGNFYSIFNTEDKKARSVDPKMYLYPFENIVFEGGGNKGLAYCGAVRLLEELNIWPQIHRLAGTSAGAMTAALLAVGYNSHDLEQFFSLNLNKIFLDHKFGYLSLLPNLLTSYGWNPGDRIYKWFGQKLQEKTEDMDITFKQVYERYNRELCIVVTNLNQMTSLYCHPKTTPDMPVRMAVRMSMSIPGMFKAIKYTLYGQTDIFVDGGVLCNYPIHCFDGWWLSMKPEDNFLERLQPLEDIPRLLERSERFGPFNEKTLGMQLYSDNEQDLLKYQLENLRHGVQLQELPNTKLARDKIKKKKMQLKTDREHRRLVKAMNAFLRALNIHNVDKNDTIDREELQASLNDETNFPRKRRLILFGDVDSDVILDYLDKDHNGQISYNELLSFMEETGISMQNRFLGYQRCVINNFPSFLNSLQATLLTNVKRVYVEERDLKRTVGINTGHVATSDFVLEPADVEFVIERGRRSLEAFLKYYVATHHLKKRPEYRRCDDDRFKASKESLNTSSSNQSLDIANNESSLTVPGANVFPHGLSPLAAEVKSSDGILSPIVVISPSFTTPKEKFLFPAYQEHSCVSRTKSGSSGKSVSISDKVEILEDRVEYNTVDVFDEKEEEDGNSDDAPQESDSMFLLGDEYEDKHQEKHPDIYKTGDNSLFHKASGLNSPKLKHVKAVNDSSSSTKETIKMKLKSSLKVDVQIHKSPEKSKSPTAPLLQER